MLLAILAVEGVLRINLTRLSRNAAHIATIPLKVERLGNASGRRILLVGNSQLRHGVDVAAVTSGLERLGHPVTCEALHPHGTSIQEWEALIRARILPSPNRPDLLVLLGTASHLCAPNYTTYQLEQVGADYTRPRDVPLLLGRLKNVDEGGALLMGSLSVAYSSRRATRRRVLTATVPYYPEATVWINRLALRRLSTPSRDPDCTLLRALLRQCQDKDLQVLIVLTPMRDDPDYQIPSSMLKILKEFHVELYDAREKHFEAEDFLDGTHLNERGRVRFTEALVKRLALVR
ncbi:MAG: hypothetical protein JKY65_16505 [Planctomycetes bacterium]|nr:hypothetical protein [Planctomycetota bacterium]